MSKHHKTIVPLVVPAARTFPRRFLFRIVCLLLEIQTSIVSAAQRTKSDSFKKKFVTKKERERTKGIYRTTGNTSSSRSTTVPRCARACSGRLGSRTDCSFCLFVFFPKSEEIRHFCAGLFDTQNTTQTTKNDAERTVNESETTRRSTFAAATTRVRAKRVQQLPEERLRIFLVFGRRRRRDDE